MTCPLKASTTLMFLNGPFAPTDPPWSSKTKCKGQGGCGEFAGQNACKAQGECGVPLNKEAWAKARAAFEKQAGTKGMAVGAAPSS